MLNSTSKGRPYLVSKNQHSWQNNRVSQGTARILSVGKAEGITGTSPTDMASQQKTREWRTSIAGRDYLITTDQTNISHDFVKASYGTDDMYWAKPVPLPILRTILANSLVLSVFEVLPNFPPPKTSEGPSSPDTPSPTLEDPSFYFSNEFQGSGTASEKLEQVGFARFITDNVTVFYLTDEYIAPEHRGKGLSKWLIGCCNEIVESKPHHRRTILMASPDKGKEFYEQQMGVRDIREEMADGHIVAMSRQGGR